MLALGLLKFRATAVHSNGAVTGRFIGPGFVRSSLISSITSLIILHGSFIGNPTFPLISGLTRPYINDAARSIMSFAGRSAMFSTSNILLLCFQYLSHMKYGTYLPHEASMSTELVELELQQEHG